MHIKSNSYYSIEFASIASKFLSFGGEVPFLFQRKGVQMEIKSNDFSNNSPIPEMYTCDGRDISPHLSWSNFPKETRSFALSVIDPDAPKGNFIHWLICDIPKDVNSIPRGGHIPGSAKEVENDFGRKQYGGPCPPSGTHRYFFTVYALDAEHLENVNKGNFISKVEEHKIDSTEIIGLYRRR